MREVIKLALLTAAICCGLLAPVVSHRAQADQGVSVDLSSISVDEKLSPGGRYRLPPLTVRNIGDQEDDYQVVIVHLNTSLQSAAPAGWFDIEPSQFHLAPQEARIVQVHIDLPSGADPDSYTALVEARAEPAGEGVQLTAAAASRVSFEVKSSSLFEAWLLEMRRSFADQAPWSYLALAGLFLLIVALLSRRFLRLRVGVERRL
jgi:hypothetical protein